MCVDKIKNVLYTLLFLLTPFSIIGNNINFYEKIDKSEDIFNIAIDKSTLLDLNIFIDVKIYNINNELISNVQTSNIIIQNNIAYIDYNQVKNKLIFILGDENDFLFLKEGKYYIDVHVFNSVNKSIIGNLKENFIISKDNKKDKEEKNKNFKVGLNVENINRYEFLTEQFPAAQYSRLNISPKFTLFDIPLLINISFEKNQLSDNKFKLINYNLSFDQNAIKNKIMESFNQSIDSIISSADTSKINQLNNIIYSSITDENKNWNELIKLYNNDSIQKILKKIEAAENVLKKYDFNSLESIYQNAIDSLDFINNNIKDSLSNNINDYINNINKQKEKYETIIKNYKSLIKIKEEIDTYKDQFGLVIENIEKIKQLNDINPLAYLNEYNIYNKFLNSDIISKKLKFLSGIKDFGIGTDIINWNNLGPNGLYTNGINLNYQYKKVFFKAFAGVTPISIFKKNNDRKDIPMGIALGIGEQNKKSVEVYYNRFKSEKYNLDSINLSKNLIGLTLNYIIKEKLLLQLENGYSWASKNDLGYIAKGNMLLYLDSYKISNEIRYKNNKFNSLNSFNNIPENISVETELSKSFLKNKVSMIINNFFGKKTIPDSSSLAYLRDNISVSINTNIEKYKLYMNLICSYATYKFKTNNEAEQLTPNNVINIGININKNLKTKQHTDISLNTNYFYSRNISNNIYNTNNNAIIITAISTSYYSQQTASIMSRYTFSEHSIRNNLSLSKIKAMDDYYNLEMAVGYMNKSNKYINIEVVTSYLYNSLEKSNNHGCKIDMNTILSIKKCLRLNILTSYAKNKVFNQYIEKNYFLFQTGLQINL